jgi:hypothetical protein
LLSFFPFLCFAFRDQSGTQTTWETLETLEWIRWYEEEEGQFYNDPKKMRGRYWNNH